MRDFGLTNAAPYASAPAVGAAGDTYWNTTESVLYVSTGTVWAKVFPVGNYVTATVTFSTSTTGSWLKVTDLPSLTTRGAAVLLLGPHGLYAANASATPYNVWLKWLRDGATDLWVTTWQTGHAGTQPLPPHVAFDTPAAGAHVYSLYILPTGTGTTIGSSGGLIGAYEMI